MAQKCHISIGAFMKKFFNDFKEFALRGNALNLAVGVIIGAAFQSIVRSLTDNILSPIIGLLTKGNLDTLKISAFGAEIRYGAFITAIINFFIMALVVFLIVKGINKLFDIVPKNKEPAAGQAMKECPYCLTAVPKAATRCPACTSQLDSQVD
jgi:large conductance mechanosensitive channel